MSNDFLSKLPHTPYDPPQEVAGRVVETPDPRDEHWYEPVLYYDPSDKAHVTVRPVMTAQQINLKMSSDLLQKKIDRRKPFGKFLVYMFFVFIGLTIYGAVCTMGGEFSLFFGLFLTASFLTLSFLSLYNGMRLS